MVDVCRAARQHTTELGQQNLFLGSLKLDEQPQKWHLLSCNDWELYGAFFKHPIKSHGHYHSSNMEIVKTSAMSVIAIIL